MHTAVKLTVTLKGILGSAPELRSSFIIPSLEPLLARRRAVSPLCDKYTCILILHTLYQERPKGGRSVQQRGTAFDSERYYKHFPYM